ncbi:MAG TPA: SIMPL domain-containing protein [Thermoanaerobaculia bacterium]|nr:SIMPL domain-containing protein [Thermoanaerobaculia bacterium]
MKRFLSTLILITIATGALAQTPSIPIPPPESISVSGIGRSSVTPDRFSFNVGVQTVALTVDDAVAENNKRVAAVIAALKAAGAQDKDIQTSNFNIWPQQDHQEGRQPRITGYQVVNNVNVRSTKVADAGRLLGIAIGAGVNTSSGINFEVADPARGRDQGLRAAFNDAKAKATLLAQAAGRTLGRVLMISEGVQSVPPQPYPYQRAMAMEARVGNADVPVEAGSQEQTYTVSVTFELR